MEGLVSQDSSKHISIWGQSLHDFGPGTTSEDEMDSSHEARAASLNDGFSSATVWYVEVGYLHVPSGKRLHNYGKIHHF